MYDSHPTMVHIEVTDKCNSECAVCPRNIHGGAIHENIKNIQLGVEYFKLLGEEFICQIKQWQFCGTRGDPMANTEIVEIVEYLRDVNRRNNVGDAFIIIRTNGGIGGVERFARLSELIGPMGFMCFSVDGLKDTNHIYRKNVKWDKIQANMDTYLAGPGIMHWDFIVFKHNFHQLDEVKTFCKENNVHLEIKEPFGFEGGFGVTEGSRERAVYTMPVYDRRTGELLYEIEPETENEIPDFLHGHQPGRMGTKYHGAKVIRREFPKKQQITSYRNEFAPMNYLAWYKNYVGQFDYNCEAIDKNELFIDCDGQFLPCCFLASAQFMEEPQITDMLSKVDTSKHYPTETWTPKDILNSEFFVKTIPDGFEGKLDDEIGSCSTCVKMCGKEPTPTQEEITEALKWRLDH